MPYIAQTDRRQYETIREIIKNTTITNKGDLEYLITLLQLQFIKENEYRYARLHDVVYATVHAAHEFERRYLDTYEDQARQDPLKGDVEL